MFSALTITSTKQGFTFDAAASADAFAAIERIARFVAGMLRTAVDAVRGAQEARLAACPARLTRV
jgi:hypothetical protein